MSLRLNGSTSGYTEIEAPAVAGDNTLVLPTGNGTANYPLTTNGSGTLSWSQIQTAAIADANITPAKLSSGMLLKAQHSTDAGSSTTSTSYVNANAGTINFTPVSTNSTIVIIAAFRAIILNGYFGVHAIYEGANVRSSYVENYATSASVYTPACISCSMANTSTATRGFTMYHRTTNAGGAVYTNAINFTILEYAN